MRDISPGNGEDETEELKCPDDPQAWRGDLRQGGLLHRPPPPPRPLSPLCPGDPRGEGWEAGGRCPAPQLCFVSWGQTEWALSRKCSEEDRAPLCLSRTSVTCCHQPHPADGETEARELLIVSEVEPEWPGRCPEPQPLPLPTTVRGLGRAGPGGQPPRTSVTAECW